MLIFLDGFLDGFTAAGLFGKLRRPGAPTELVDSRSVEEFIKSGEFDSVVRQYQAADLKPEKPVPSAPLVDTFLGHR